MSATASPLATGFLSGLAPRLAAILAPLRQLVAARLLRIPALVPFIVPLWNYLGRAERRIARLATLFAAGRLPTPRAGRTGRCGPGGARPLLPTRKAWLLEALRHEAGPTRHRLESLLAEPGMAAFLAASPAAAGTIRALCRMLGVTAPPRPHPPRPRRPRRQPPPPPPSGPALLHPPPARILPPLCPRLAERWPWVALRSATQE